MNSLTITGNLGKDAELKYLQDGAAVLSFSVADSMGKEKGTIWWNCAMFGKRAESLSQYMTKGQQVTVVGVVTEREYTDKTGAQRKSIDVRVSDVALQGGRKDEPQPAPRPIAAPANRAPERAKVQQFDDISDDIPF